MRWTARIRTRMVVGWRFFLLLGVETRPDVHSASCKMSTGAFSGVQTDERRAIHPTSSQCRGCEYVETCIHIPRGPSWPIMGITLPFYMVFTVLFIITNSINQFMFHVGYFHCKIFLLSHRSLGKSIEYLNVTDSIL